MNDRTEAVAEVVIAAPIAEVWRALADPSVIAEWSLHFSRGDVRPGGSIVWDLGGGEFCEATIVDMEPPERLRMTFRWTRFPEWRSTVEARLVPDGDRTRVQVVHRGFLEEPSWQRRRVGFAIGWQDDLDRIQALLEIGRGIVVTKFVDESRLVSVDIQGAEEAELETLIQRAATSVERAVRDQRAEPRGVVIIYHQESPWKVEVGCAFAGKVVERKDVRVHPLGEGRVVARPLRHHTSGPWHLQHAQRIRRWILNWCHSNGYVPAGPVREVYPEGFAEGQETVVGEIQVPVAKQAGRGGRRRNVAAR